MKNWVWIPLAAILGIVVGSWGPREDLKLLKEKSQDEQVAKKSSSAAGFDAFAHLANIPDRTTKRPAAQPKPPHKPAETNDLAATRPAPDKQPAAPAHRPRLSPEDLRARIDEAVELWNVRVELATKQWKEKLGIADGKASADFDAALADMNEAIRETMQEVADEIEKTGKMTPELGLRLMGDVTRTMAETYDVLGATLDESQRADVSEMPVFEFIDPSVAEPLIGVQDKLEGGFRSLRR